MPGRPLGRVVPESVEQVTGFALLAATAAIRAIRRFRGRVLGVARVHYLQVAGVEAVEFRGGQGGSTGLPGGVDRRLDRQQMVDHGLGPRLRVLLPQEDEFAQQMRVREGVVAVILQVGAPEVVDGATLKVRQRGALWAGRRPWPRARVCHGRSTRSTSGSRRCAASAASRWRARRFRRIPPLQRRMPARE